MSVIATVFVPEGIAMAADSRITATRTYTDKPVEEKFTISDNGQKIFALTKRTAGISACGDAEIGGRTIADFIRQFEIDQIQGGESIEEVAKALQAYLYCKGKERNIVCHVAGYDGDVQSLYVVTKDSCVSIISENLKYGAKWDGDINHLTDLINGASRMTFDWNFMYLKDAVELAEFMVDVNCKAQRFSAGIATCGGPIDILLLTKDGGQWVRHKILKP